MADADASNLGTKVQVKGGRKRQHEDESGDISEGIDEEDEDGDEDEDEDGDEGESEEGEESDEEEGEGGKSQGGKKHEAQKKVKTP